MTRTLVQKKCNNIYPENLADPIQSKSSTMAKTLGFHHLLLLCWTLPGIFTFCKSFCCFFSLGGLLFIDMKGICKSQLSPRACPTKLWPLCDCQRRFFWPFGWDLSVWRLMIQDATKIFWSWTRMLLFLFFPSRFLGESSSCKEYGCSYIKDGSPDKVYCFRDGVYQAEAGDECPTDATGITLPNDMVPLKKENNRKRKQCSDICSGISTSRLLSLLPYPTLLEIEHHTSSEPEWDQYIALLGITGPGGESSSAELDH